MTPVSVLTGFLGSGKTTLLAALLRRPEFGGTAVVMNEFGDVALDHHLIETSDENLIVLSTGCLCCAARGDITRTIGELLARRAAGEIAFERIVIETTGIADPAPILQGLMLDASLAGVVRLGRVVATVDALAGPATLASRGEARRQAAFADQLVVTKADLAGAEAAAALAVGLAALNPTAQVTVAAMGAVDPAVLLPDLEDAPTARWATLAAEIDRVQAHRHDHAHAHDHGRPHGSVLAVVLRREAPVRAAALPLFLEALAETFGPKLLRLKGLVAIAEAPDRPAVIHGVQHVIHPPVWLDAWPDADRATRLVLIGEGLEPGWPDLLLDLLDEEAAAAAG